MYHTERQTEGETDSERGIQRHRERETGGGVVGGGEKTVERSVLTAVVRLSPRNLSQPINSVWWNTHT